MFVVLCGIVAVPALIAFIALFPREQEIWGVYGCSLQDTAMTKARAIDYQKNGIPEADFYPWALEDGSVDRFQDCTAEIRAIADGSILDKKVSQHWRDASWVGLVLAALLVTLYALGWSVGWIWRGFFPKRSGAA
ncbi:hypothetical protein [Arenimonas sp.]|uniref:hypothetical protein n=1 Tax=Arenimonas sp. TaxID=1872635 RepID=UPI002E3275ED|nr:hypothetical protein [Arenimonas sp.]HEX4852753.1 hypothetical protein [Arenimonas sp.]